MKQIAEVPWSYTLFCDAEGYVLQVLCGGIAMYFLSIRLTVAESANFDSLGLSYIDDLAKQIKRRPSLYSGRAVDLDES